jgi:large subunit ribosomal protein L25
MAHVALTAQQRTEFGNGPTRRLRRAGLVPGVIYQPGGPSLALSLRDRELRRALAEGRTGVIDLRIDEGAPRPVLLKDWQLHPVNLDVLYVDVIEVDLEQEIEAPVAIVLTGMPIGVREDGGILDQPLREVTVSALPDALPDHIEVDVDALGIGDALTVADLTAPAGVRITADPETVVASVVAPTVVTTAEEEELEGAAPAADGAAAQPAEDVEQPEE